MMPDLHAQNCSQRIARDRLQLPHVMLCLAETVDDLPPLGGLDWIALRCTLCRHGRSLSAHEDGLMVGGALGGCGLEMKPVIVCP